MSDLKDEEIVDIVNRTARSSFKYLIKRITNEITKKHTDIELNIFINMILESIALSNANSLAWAEEFLKDKYDKEISVDLLSFSLHKKLIDILGIKIQ